MRITGLRVENVKKVKVVDITPPEDVVILSGANEQGKTSVLDAIQLVLDERNANKDIREPIRRGQDHAESYLFLGDPVYDEAGKEVECKPNLKASRTWTKKGSYLKLENMDGAVFRSPQSILDGLIGGLTFDPLAFSRLEDKKQLETLLQLVQIPLDLKVWGEERQAVYDERTAMNRQVKDLEAQVKGCVVPEDAPDEEISAASVLEEQRKAQAVINQNNQERRRLSELDDRLTAWHEKKLQVEARVASAERELQVAKQSLQAIIEGAEQDSAAYKEQKDKVASLQDPDLSTFQARIAEVEGINRHVRAKNERGALVQKLNAATKTSGKYTERLFSFDEQRADALRTVTMPVDGLGFDDNGVTYNGIPFRQCSSEERLRVSVAMGMALNPKLRVMFVRDGSLLDTKNREVIRQMARDNQYQIWMELTDESGKVGLVLEDGEIKAKKE